MSVLIAFRKEWLELIRSYRMLVVVIILVFFGLTSPVLAKFTPELMTLIPTGDISISMPPPTVMTAIGQYVKNMAQFGIILGLLEGVTTMFIPVGWVPVIEYVIFVIILLVRPAGLFGAR